MNFTPYRRNGGKLKLLFWCLVVVVLLLLLLLFFIGFRRVRKGITMFNTFGEILFCRQIAIFFDLRRCQPDLWEREVGLNIP